LSLVGSILGKYQVLSELGRGDLQIEIGSREWHIAANQYRPIRFRPGEYDYLITLEDRTRLEQHAAWHAGDNGQLQIFAGDD
jgi:hypothetical protein